MATRHACYTAEHLVDYLSDRLGSEEQQQVEDHIAECTVCSELSHRLYRLTVAWDRMLAPDAPWKTVPAAQSVGWLERLIGTLQGAALVALSGPKLAVEACAAAVRTAAAPALSRSNIDALLVGRPAWPIAAPVPEFSRSASFAGVESSVPEMGTLMVDVDHARRVIVVSVDGYPPQPTALPVVRLLRKNGPERIGEWIVTDSTDRADLLAPAPRTFPARRTLRAEFHINEDDDYLVAVR